ncbi:sodium/proton antiporter, CPA1 family [Pedococcus dokdonensis]|uniref:Sodium/proton antiporter, CPA1 family n=1 Tax=Pedococcus dokdonensis TaxID=443156 RepID=A0A1H0RJC5_9MICO|nr:Na+/H+ antiporter [Pedococcus dokdonensis]SDP29663.1 sodium/proton antiporter, CPA1 family [Pedococcus dokdonensis]
MGTAGAIVAIIGTVIVVAGFAQRLRVAAPLALLVVGVAASYVPWFDNPELSSEVVLVGLLPPLLYAAAIRTSLVDFRANLFPILGLSVGLVLFTAAGVGLVSYWILGVPFAVAFALGAIVAPPDAVAATAVARRIGLPRRIVTILEGESLVNDATALVSLRTAIAAFPLAAAAVGGHTDKVTLGSVALDFTRAVVLGVGFGVVVGLVIAYVRRKVTESAIDTSISFIVPYLAYLPAEKLHGSGVLAVVVAGLLLGHKSPIVQNASSRVSERINWSTIQFILENVVFLMLGLQMRRLVSDASETGPGWGTIVATCLAVLATVIILRPIWVFPFKWVQHRFMEGEGKFHPKAAAVISWAGMRGVVTLAAAFALPAETPQRSTLVLAAMAVTVATLLLQGLSLPWLAKTLGVRGPDPREDALQEATILQSSVAAGLKALEEHDDVDGEIIETLRSRAENRTNIVWERLGQGRADAVETPSATYRRVRMIMLDAERTELLRIRDAGTVDQEVLGHVFAQLDIEESMLDRIEERSDELREDPLLPPERAEDECEHLASHHDRFVAPTSPHGCEECLRDGTTWVHLRLCLDCGHVGCCDSSPQKHASAHFREDRHPVMRSFEPGESWRWCFVDEQLG